MAAKERLVPVLDDVNKVIGFMTFYIGNGNVDKYIRHDMWSVLDDEPDTGEICYVDQLITNKDKLNPKRSFKTFNLFKQMIKERFPQVHTIRWNRYKKGRVHVYNTSIK